MGHRPSTGGILAHIEQFHAERRHSWLPARWVQRMAIAGMMKKVLVSVVDDDRIFRECMCRLMRLLGYTVDISRLQPIFSRPPACRLACLIADVHMPAMTGLELYRQLIDTGQAIPTILLTAFPNDVDRARAPERWGRLLPAQTGR
jgi:CheY-like chemotaxis protein